MRKTVNERKAFMSGNYMYWVGMACLLSAGCTMKQAGFTAVGTAAGGGIGYSINHDTKDAVIGGLGGALVGNLTAQWQERSDKIKHNKGYEEGYSQAKVDAAVKNWDDNTGKGMAPKKQLVSIMLPKREENNVIYDQRKITVEDYQ